MINNKTGYKNCQKSTISLFFLVKFSFLFSSDFQSKPILYFPYQVFYLFCAHNINKTNKTKNNKRKFQNYPHNWQATQVLINICGYYYIKKKNEYTISNLHNLTRFWLDLNKMQWHK